MRNTKIAAATVAVGTATALALSVPSAGAGGRHHQGSSADAVGLAAQGTAIVPIDFGRHQDKSKAKQVTGLDTDTALIGIDYRVQDGKLYGVGNSGGIYTIDTKTAKATLDARPRVALPDAGPFAVDFNPAANALRILSSSGANLRVPFATPSAAVTDTPLTRPAVAPATGTVPATGLTGGGYTNNDLDAATATVLYDIDTERDQLVVQSPANAGTTAPVGSLGVDVGPDAGFDVYSHLSRGKTVSNVGIAVHDGRIYQIDLTTGAAKSVAKLKVPGVTDIAVALDR